METSGLDNWLRNFLEEKWWIAAAAVVAVSLLQLYFYITKEPTPFLHPDIYQDLLLKHKQNVNHNTRFLQFKLQDERQRMGLPVGQHALFKFTNSEGKSIIRPYTPVSGSKTTGHVDFVIKVYPKGEMSQHIDKLDVGDRISAKGPRGKFTYRRNMKKALGMICGGTGITPMYQVLNHILSDPKDKTRLYLIYANITSSDILLKKDLDRLAAQHPTRFDLFFVVEKQEPSNWKGGVGFVTKDMIKEHCPPPSSNIMMLHCGPPPMTEAMMKACDDLGYSIEQQFKF